MINILIVSILILPWLILPFPGLPEPTRLIKATFFDFAMLAIVCTALTDGLKYEYKNKYLGWLCAWIFVTVGFNWYYPLIRGFGYNAGAIESYLHVLLAIVGTIFVCSNIERNDFVRIAKAIVFSATLVAAFGFLQIIGLDPMKSMAHYSYKEVRHVCALMDHPDLLGNYLALSIPFFLYFKKPKYIAGLLLVIIVLFFCKSTISYAAAIVASLAFLFMSKIDSKKWIIGTVAAFIIFVALFAVNPSLNKFHGGFSGRQQAWQMMINRIENPAFGQGLGIVKSLNVQIGEDHWFFAHNDYLEVYCSLGVLGLFLLSLVVINAFRKFNYTKDNILGFAYFASFIAFLIISFGSFPMEIAPLALGGLISFWGISKV